uniref:Nuclear pore complex protein DDB_G0274915-like isoform X1 n=1 Tax=Hirondellea gigas TaxID=1518452 RepID=A0A6A7G9U2_9CRUS
MWSAMNWLSQKAGINLDDASEVINSIENSNNLQLADADEQASESSKENLSCNSNGATPVLGSKRSRRPSRWSSGSNSSASYHGSSPPITPMMLATAGGGAAGSSGMGGSYRTSHPPMPPIMVPTGPRSSGSGAGYGAVPGMMLPSSMVLGSGTKHSPSGLHWKEVSMAADVTSPGFTFRLVRQAEKQADINSRIYPTAQDKYLATKHLPNVRLRGPPKTVTTPNKPRSIPLVPLVASSPPSPHSGSPSLAPILGNPAVPAQNSAMLPSNTPTQEYRPTHFFASSSMRGLDTGSNNSSMNVSGDFNNGELTVSNSSITSIAVTAAMNRSNTNSADISAGGVHKNISSSGGDLLGLGGVEEDDTQDCGGGEEDCEGEADPTSLKSVLAALNKSQAGKGVKRARITDFDEMGSKRQCSNSLPESSVGSDSATLNSRATVSAATATQSTGGEKRALDTSTCSSQDNSGHGSPNAKMPRTANASDDYTGDAAATNGHQVPDDEDDNSGKENNFTNDSFANSNSSSARGKSSANGLSSLNGGVGLGGGRNGSMLDEDELDDGMEYPKKKKRCVNPWVASMSSSRKMLIREQTGQKAESECSAFDTQNDDSDSDDKSSVDSDHMSEQSVDLNDVGSTEAEASSANAFAGESDGLGASVAVVGGGGPIGTGSGSAPASSSDREGLSQGSVTPHVVTLSAHRSDKRTTHTRLNKMLGLLFHLTEEEAESSTSPPKVPAPTAAASETAPPPRLLSLISDGGMSTGDSESDSPNFNVPLVPKESSTQSSDCITNGFATTSSMISSSKLDENLGDVSVSTTVSLPATKVFGGLLTSNSVADATSGSVTVVSSSVSGNTVNVLSSALTSPQTELTRATTLPVNVTTTAVDSGSDVSASFTFSLPNKSASAQNKITAAVVVTKNDSVASEGPPSYSEANESKSSVIDGANSLLAFLSASKSPTAAKANADAPPAFNTGTGTNAGEVLNPLLAGFSAPTNKDSNLTSSGFAPSSSTTFVPQTSSAAVTNVATPATATNTTGTAVAPGMFSFGTGKPSGGFSFGTVAAGDMAKESVAVTSATPATSVTSPPSFSFGNNAASGATTDATKTASDTGMFSFGGEATKQIQEPSAAAKTGGFTFGSVAAATGSQQQQQQTEQMSSPNATFTFGHAASANADSNASSTQKPDSTKSLFPFGSSNQNITNPLLNTTSLAPAQEAISSGTATTSASMFTFVSNPTAASATGAAATTTTTAATAAPSTNLFSFGSSAGAANTASVNPSTNPGTGGGFTFGTVAVNSNKSSLGGSSSSTSASFTFTGKSPVASTDSSKNTASPFSFGGSAINTIAGATAPSTTQEASFTFGSAAGAAVPAVKPAGNSLFSFVASPANPTSVTSTFGTLAGNNSAPSFGTASAAMAPTFGTATSNIATNASSTFGSNNPFGGAAASAVTSKPNTTFEFGTAAPTLAKSTKTVTFGLPSVQLPNQNMFGQVSSTAQNTTANTLFGQVGGVTTSSNSSSNNTNIFGQSSNIAAPSFGSSTFGQAASTASTNQNKTSTGPATATVSPFQFGGAATSSTPGSSTFSFGGASNTSAVPAFGAPTSNNPAPTFGAAALVSGTGNAAPVFGAQSGTAPPTFGASTVTIPTFGASNINSGATPSFGAAVGSSGSSGAFGVASTVGAAVPTFGTPAATGGAGGGGSSMFQFSSGNNAGTPQQPNAFNAGGNPASTAASRRPRVRAHRRNR